MLHIDANTLNIGAFAGISSLLTKKNPPVTFPVTEGWDALGRVGLFRGVMFLFFWNFTDPGLGASQS